MIGLISSHLPNNFSGKLSKLIAITIDSLHENVLSIKQKPEMWYLIIDKPSTGAAKPR